MVNRIFLPRVHAMSRLVLAAGLILGAAICVAQGIGTTITYQGRLSDGGVVANGSYDLRLRVYDALSGGAQVGGTTTVEDVVVTQGLFTVQTNFGNVFTGGARWIEIGVRPGASNGSFTFLAPRQELRPVPNALFASLADKLDNLNSSDFARATHQHAATDITTPPLELVAAHNGRLILAENSGGGASSHGIEGANSSLNGAAAGVRGWTFSSNPLAAGVSGAVMTGSPGEQTAGVRGSVSQGAGGIGVLGLHAGDGPGVYGSSKGGVGVVGESAHQIAVQGNSEDGTAGQFNTTAASSNNRALEVYNYGLGPAGYFRVANTTNTSEAIRALHDGTGSAVRGIQGSGSGLSLNSRPAILGETDAGIGVAGTNQTGVGVYGASLGLHGVMGLSTVASAAGVLGRNDVAGGYGVEALCAGDGTGLYATSLRGYAGWFVTPAGNAVSTVQIGQAGTGPGVVLNVSNPANNQAALWIDHAGSADALRVQANGNGGTYAASVVGTGLARGLYVQTASDSGLAALRVGNGNIVLNRQAAYTSGTTPDDPIIVISTAGAYTIPTAAPVLGGQTMWVVNDGTGGPITITNVIGGAFAIANNRAQQFMLVPEVSGANWVACQ